MSEIKKIWNHFMFNFYVASRKWKITCVAYIIFLLDLHDLKKQNSEEVWSIIHRLSEIQDVHTLVAQAPSIVPIKCTSLPLV